MKRREFLSYTSGAALAASLSRVDQALALDSTPVGWRTFEVTTHVEVLKPSGATRVWLPAALLGETPFQRTLANDFKAEGGTAKLVEQKADALGIVVADFPTEAKPAVTLTSRIATKNYEVDLSKPSGVWRRAILRANTSCDRRNCCRRMELSKQRRMRLPPAVKRTLKKHAPSTNGLWKTHFGIPKPVGAAPATFATCWRPKISEASAQISMHFTLVLRERLGCQLAMSTASGSPNRNLATKVSVLPLRT
jgi:hypothetical protein